MALRREIGSDEARLGREEEGRGATFVKAPDEACFPRVSVNPCDYSAGQER